MAPSSTSRVAALAAFVVALCSACGGGGGSSGQSSGALGFRLLWQQRGTSQAAPSEQAREAADRQLGEGRGAGFEGPIPPAVSAIRFIVTPTAAPGSACCVAVLRDSDAFERRSLAISELVPGQIDLEVAGYPAKEAPSDGVSRTCATSPPDPGVVACSGSSSLLPSYGADPVQVTVAPGKTSDAGDIQVYSLPFLIDLDPPPGGHLDEGRPLLRLSVVDAAQAVASDLQVTVETPDSAQAIPVDAEQLTECDDRAAEEECSPSGELDVTGLVFEGRPRTALPSGAATVRVQAHNDDDPARTLDADYDIFVGTTSTTATSTTSSTLPSTTTTTLPATTTTLPATTTTIFPATTTTTAPGPSCLVRFALGGQEAQVTAIQFTVDYGAANGDFVGSGSDVACTSLVEQQTTLVAFHDGDAAHLLTVGMVTAPGSFLSAEDLVECQFVAAQQPAIEDFQVEVTEAVGPDDQSVEASVQPSAIQCE